MSVLRREDLEDSPLADLHAIASELGLEGYRSKRKPDLVKAILDASGGAEEEPSEAESESFAARELEARSGAGEVAPGEGEPSEAESESFAARELDARAGAGEAAGADDSSEDTSEGTSEDTSEGTSEDTSEGTSSDTSEDTSEGTSEGTSAGTSDDEASAPVPAREEQLASGVLDILANGSGFIRVEATGQARDDVYVSPAQIRRCELRAGDEVGGPVRPPRRNERHPSLVHVSSVNGADADPPEERPWFGELTPVFPSSRLPAPPELADAPFGRGSRVAIAGPPGAGASTLLRSLAAELAKDSELAVQAVLVGVRPEELGEWRAIEGLEAVGDSFDRSPEAQAQAAELAIERAKRRVERGGHVVVLLDSLGPLSASARRRVFGAARATEQGGTLTVIAAAGDAPETLRWASTRIVLEPGGKLVSAESGTLRADALAG